MNNSSTLQQSEFCKECGAEVLPAMVRCRNCGTAKSSSANSQNNPLDKPLSDSKERSNKINSAKQTAESIENSIEASDRKPQNGNAASITTKQQRIKSKCKNCGQIVKAPLSLAGTIIPCPKCGQKVSLPKQKTQKNSLKEVVETHKEQHLDLLSFVKEALQESNQNNSKIQQSKPPKLKGKTKKLMASVEAACGSSVGFEAAQNAKNSIQQLVEMQSTQCGEILLDLLPKMSDKIRPAAIRAVGELQVPNALEFLLYTLLSSTAIEVESAIHALGDYGDIAAVKPLLVLPILHPEQRFRATVAISKLGEDALPALLEVLENSNSEEMRFAAMESLKSLRSSKSVEALLSIIQRDGTALRRMAVEALGEIEHPKKHRILMKLAQDKDPQIRSIVLESLARNPHQSSITCFISGLDDDSTEVQKSAITGIGELGEQTDKSVIARIIKFLDSDDTDFQFMAARTISKLGDRRITPQILKLLKKELKGDLDTDKIRSLVKSLQRLKDPRAVLPLCELLEGDFNSSIKRRVIEALGAIGDRAAKPAIENHLVRDESSEVRAVAAQALGAMGDESAVTALIQALHDSQNVRIQALIALGKLKSTKVGPVIKDMLIDPSSTVRYQAINIMTESGNPSHIPLIEPLVCDTDEMVQRAAMKALKSLGDERSEKEIQKTASKAQRNKKAKQLQHGMLPNSVVGLFSGIPGGVATGFATIVLLIVAGLFFFPNPSGSASTSKVVVRGYVGRISVDEAGETAVVSRTRGLTEVWSLNKNERIWSGDTLPSASGIILSSKNESLFVTSGDTVLFFDISSSGEISNPKEKKLHDSTIMEVAASSNRHFAFTLDADKTAHVWNIQQKKSISNRSLPEDVTCLAVDNKGEKMLAGGNRGLVKIWNPNENEAIYDNQSLMGQLKVRGTTNSIAISKDSKYLAHSTTSGELMIVELESGKLLSKIDLPPGKSEIYYNNSDELIVVNAKIYKIVDLRNGELVHVADAIRARTTTSFCSETDTILMGSDEEKPVTAVKMQTGKRVEFNLD